MSVFGKIMSAIFGSSEAKAATAGGGAVAAQSIPQVDVEKVVSEMAAHKKEKLDWRKSIVDLMKVLDLDSGPAARKELAKELGYTGDMADTAKMNVWLHKQVMQKLAANGGKVPADLK